MNDQTTLKCSICSCFLSVPPITVVSSDGKNYKCGRCCDIFTVLNIRNWTYEILAEEVSFPCIHKGCKELIPWKDTFVHENLCKHRKILCPSTDTCKVTLNMDNIHQHFERNHKELVHYGKVICYPTTDFTVLLLKKNEIFMVFILHLPPYFYIKVFTTTLTQPKISYQYNIQIVTSQEDLPNFTFLGKDVELFNERNHCINCLKKICKLKYHKYSNSSNEEVYKDYVKIRKDYIPESQYQMEINIIANGSKKDPSNEKTVRENLICPICMELMIAPIYSCQTGHVLCSRCKRSIIKCPFCKRKMDDLRNYALEKIAEQFKLNCAFYKYGCGFIGTAEEIKSHEEVCVFSNTEPNNK